MSPVRIQRKRTKGWRMPEGAVYVGRPSRWGNLVRVRDCEPCGLGVDHPKCVLYTPQMAADFFAAYAASQPRSDFAPLRGKDLACWCPLDLPCHADVLLELANQ